MTFGGRSPLFQESNYEAQLKNIDKLNKVLSLSLYEGSDKNIKRHRERGHLLARERVDLLLDKDSPFLELMPIAGYEQDGMTTGASIVAGIGLVSGVECLISASIPTLYGGAINEMSVLKSSRLHTISVENRLPCINLTQTAGANLSQQSRVFHPGGASFRQMAERSKLGIPTATVVFGSSTAGGAYTPGMSDYVIMVKNKAQVFLGGPPLVKMATGEETDAETLGGADMHSRISGVSDHLAEDEYTAIEKVREFIKYMGWSKKAALPPASLSLVKEPLYEVGSILGIIPSDIKLPLDSMEVIKHIVDGSDFSDFKPLYGIHIVTGWAHIHGFPVGIIANNNPIFPEDANKAVQFIQLCNMRNTPILFLQNITGFMVGKKYESDGIIKAGARFINAVTNSKVPAITVVMGCSYGAGNYAMCGRAYGPRFLFSWPGSKCSVMGPDQLTGVMDIIARDSAKKLGKTLDEDVMNTRKDMFRGLVEAESDVYYTSSRLLDDAVIDPRDTRDVLGMCLCVIHGNEVSGGNLYGISRM